jgi:hypothetical protein
MRTASPLVLLAVVFVEALLRHRDLYGPAPRAPGFLAARAGGTGVELTWQATRGAARYTIERGATHGGPYTALGTSSEPGYVDAGAKPGARDFYVVTATNQVAVESGRSNEVQVAGP